MRSITTVSFPPEMATIIKTEAKLRKISISKLIRLAIIAYLGLDLNIGGDVKPKDDR